MRRESTDVAGWAVAMALVVFAALGAGMGVWCYAAFQQRGCHDRWARSGLYSEWTATSGCLVQVDAGRWLPERSVQP